MEIEATIQSADFENDTITLHLPAGFWKMHGIRAGKAIITTWAIAVKGRAECKTCNGTGKVVRTFTGSVGLESPWRAKGSSHAREDEERDCPECKWKGGE
jgi:DnaJ-class molecular chaperone